MSALEPAEAWLSSHRADLAERDVVVIRVIGDRLSGMPSGGSQPVVADDLRQRLGVASDPFALLLIGRDGSIQQRSDDRARLAARLMIIDAMPMRRAGSRQARQYGQKQASPTA